MSLRGQASTEYLVILGAVLLVSAITVSILALSSDTSSAQVQESAAYWRSTYPFIITSAKAVGPAIVLTLQNAADEPLWLDGITAEGTRMLFYEYSGDVFGASRCPNGLDSCSIPVDIGQSVTVAARGSSECLSRSFSLDDVQFTYSNLDLTGLLQAGDRPLAGYCSQKVTGIILSPPSPANDSWFSTGSNVTINATIQGMALSGLNLTWNESTTRIYDESLVLAMNFDDVSAVGDTAGKIVDVSQYGNNGTVYGNTQLLLHMDEADGYRVYDESRFANNGTIYGNTKAIYHFDENAGAYAYDSGLYNYTGNITGATWVAGKSGTGLDFDGVDDYARFPTTMLNNISMTVVVWFKPGEYQAIYAKVFRHYYSGNRIYLQTNTSSNFYGWTVGLTSNVYTAEQAGLWVQYAFTLNNGTVTFYRNGQNNGGAAYTDLNSFDPAFFLGSAGESQFFNGTIDEVAIFNRTLTSAEVLDHYNAGRAKFAEWTTGKSGTGLQFDGVNDYAVTSSFAIPASTNAVTYEFWAKSGTLSGIQTLLSEGVQTTNGFIWIYRASGSSHQMAFQYGNGTYYYAVYFPHTFDSGSNPDFIHLVVVADYTANSVSVYRNGAYLSSASMVAGLFPSSNRPKYLGAFGGNQAYFNGTLDEIGIYSRALTPEEILSHYNAGKARHADWTPDGKVGSAMTFDGVDDQINCGNDPSLNITRAITIGAWIKPSTAPSGIGTIVSAQPDSSYFLYLISSSTQLRIRISGNEFTSPSDSITRYVWQHIAVTYDADAGANNGAIYVNGNPVTVFTSTAAFAAALGNTYLGDHWYALNSYHFKGSMDEVRIWNRTLSAAEIKQQYYSSLNKFAPDKWIFTTTEPFVPAGTYGYSIAASGLGETNDFTANRTVRVS